MGEAVKIVTPKRVGGMMKKYREILTYFIRVSVGGQFVCAVDYNPNCSRVIEGKIVYA